jgi:hypothetical protein
MSVPDEGYLAFLSFDYEQKPRYLIYCAGHVSGITFIRYAQSQNIRKLNNLHQVRSCMPVLSQNLDFQCHISWSPLFVLSKLRLEVIVNFVDIGGIVDHHCLNR